MKKLTLNFSELSQRQVQQRKLLIVVLLGIISAFLLNEYHAVKQEVAKRVTPSDNSYKVTKPTLTPKQLADINLTHKLIIELNAPWAEMMRAVEAVKVKNKHIFLTQFEPNITKQEILFSGRSDSVGDLVQFMDDLNEQTRFKDALLISQSSNEESPDEIQFNLKVRWLK